MTDRPSNLEVEVKFYVPDLETVRGKLSRLDAAIIKPRVFEQNIRFDTPGETLLQKKQLLRLRQDAAVRLTLKSQPESTVRSEAKVMEELEVSVSNFDTAVLLLRRLGFLPVQTYEKYRETWQWSMVEVVLDELPYGNFVELEGEEAAIRTLAPRLGLAWERRIVANYLELMGRLQAAHNLPFSDLTFANFANNPAAITDILP